MKKLTAIFLAFALLFSLSACGGSKTAQGEVSNIEINTDDSSIRYTGYEFVPDKFGVMGQNAEKTIYIKFEYTNKTDTPKNVREDFVITASQNGADIEMVKGWNAEIDTTGITNYLSGLAKNETLSVHYAVNMQDYSPVTVTVATIDGKTTQYLVQEITPPEDVVVPQELSVDVAELYCDWVDLHNGDVLTIQEGKYDNLILRGNASIDYKGAKGGTVGRNFSYTLEGNVLKTNKERFVVSKENEKLYLRSQDSETVYERESDFYRFEDIEVHEIGETVTTDCLEFTLKGSSYVDSVSASAIGASEKDGKDAFVPGNGQIWDCISFNLKNIGQDLLDMENNGNVYAIRFDIIYNGTYSFPMETHNWITKGYNGDKRVNWMGTGYGDGHLDLPALSSEDYDIWVPVAPALREDTEGSVHLVVFAQNSKGYEIFAYRLK